MDETTTDVVQPESGGQATPKPETSPQGAGQDSPGGESQIETLSQQVKELTGVVRALQSDKDKGVAKVSRDLKDLSEQFDTYYKRRESGMSHEQALREEALDEIVAERMGPQKDTQVSPEERQATQPKVTVEDYLSPLLKVSGLEDTDSDVIEIIRNERDPGRQMTAIAELAESRKQAQATPASPGATLSTGGGQTVQGDTLESVTEELNAELAKGVKDHARIRELRVKQASLLPKQ